MRVAIEHEAEDGEIWPSKVKLIPEIEDDPGMVEALRVRLELGLTKIEVVNAATNADR